MTPFTAQLAALVAMAFVLALDECETSFTKLFVPELVDKIMATIRKGLDA